MIVSSGRFGGAPPAPTPAQVMTPETDTIEVDTTTGQYMTPDGSTTDDE